MSTRFSPDAMYYWDGAQWLSTLSPDGRYRWDGTAWIPVSRQAASASPQYQAQRATREPTSWTRPLQYAVAAWYAIQAIYVLSLPFWMGGTMAGMVNQSLQRQQQLNPTVTPPPPAFTDAMTSIMTGALWVGALFGLAICLVAIIGALNRWIWIFYVILVLLGLGTLQLLNIVFVFSGPTMTQLSGFSMPSWTYWLQFGLSIPDAALFVWMLAAVVRRGPWAMRRVG